MATTKFEAFQEFKVGNVVVSNRVNPSYGYKLMARPFIEEIGEFRFVTQEVTIANNKATPTGVDGGYLYVKSTKDIRNEFAFLWTPDTFKMSKGQVYKDQDGNFYVAESDTKLWSLKEGTWATVTSDTTSGWSSYGSGDKTKLTLVKTIAGHDFAQYLK